MFAAITFRILAVARFADSWLELNVSISVYNFEYIVTSLLLHLVL